MAYSNNLRYSVDSNQDNHNPPNTEDIDSVIINDTIEGLKIIEERSIGLEQFVKQFRKLTLISQPKKELFPVDKLFYSIALLFEKRFRDVKIDFSYTIKGEKAEIYADKN